MIKRRPMLALIGNVLFFLVANCMVIFFQM
jgi:hypothetical protein